ncbi:hypothetical protein [Halobacillus salinarum]|uniref:hypothetical protein n=1 Tax=Halobacillus salinarum TaxID=2932257 RepID=UPI0037C1716C
MEHFLSINPGLASRFPIQLDFDNYSATELAAIAQTMLEERDYRLTLQAERKLYDHLLSVCSHTPYNFSNARYVRNLIEEAIRKHAWRVIASSNPKKNALMTLEAEDFTALTRSEYH